MDDWKSKLKQTDAYFDSMPITALRKKDTKLQEISIDENNSDSVIKRYILPKNVSKETELQKYCEYKPRSSLISHIKIIDWRTDYNYYESFYKDVQKYFDYKLEKADYQSFYSYVPQYSQMTKEQFMYYIYFRTKVRNCEFVHTDYSYLLLYIFEIINSPTNCLNPIDGIKQLYFLWKNYSKEYPAINRFIGDWIVDYALIYNVNFPTECVDSNLCQLMNISSLKEFFAGSISESDDIFIKIILEYSSNYDYKKSRYYLENKELYDKIIFNTLKTIYLNRKKYSSFGFDTQECFMKRDSFEGALCSFRIKKKIEIKYNSFSKINDFRYIIGDIVKYIENKIRESVSIKSRLTVFSLDADIKKDIDFMMLNLSVPKNRHEEVHEYDKLYLPEKKEFSFKDAEKIEEKSWNTTKLLVDAFAEENLEIINSDEIKNENNIINDSPANFDRYIELLKSVFEGNTKKAKEESNKIGEMLDSAIEKINNLSIEKYGDILIENNGTKFSIIEDYIEIYKEIIGESNGK